MPFPISSFSFQNIFFCSTLHCEIHPVFKRLLVHSFPLLHDRGWAMFSWNRAMLIGLFAYGSSPVLYHQTAELSSCHRAWYWNVSIWFSSGRVFYILFCMICHLINASRFSHSAYDGQCIVFNLRLLWIVMLLWAFLYMNFGVDLYALLFGIWARSGLTS